MKKSKKEQIIKGYGVVDGENYFLLLKEPRKDNVHSHWGYAIFKRKQEAIEFKKGFAGIYAKTWKVVPVEIKIKN